MGRKNSSNVSENDDISNTQSDEEQMEVKVEKAIKELPTLEEKIQAIAINTYTIEKRSLDQKMAAETNKIEVGYRKTYQPYLEEIFKIASGDIDLSDADFEGVEHLLTEEEQSTKSNYYPKKKIDDYWMKALISHQALAQSIFPEDEKVLSHLHKIETNKSEDGNYLSVVFHFSANQFFTNSEIKKEFEIDGETINRSFGTEIDWKEGKNLTMQIVKKRNKKKKTTTTKQVKKQSFFNIFKQIDLTSDSDDKEEEDDQEDTDVEELEKQYQICIALYEQIVPRSLEFFLGVTSGFGEEDDEMIKNAIQEGKMKKCCIKNKCCI